MQIKCYCCSNQFFKDCCEPFLKETSFPLTAEQLMRSRYSAYAIGDVDYIYNTTHSSERKYYSKKEIENWSKSNDWLKLEILYSDEKIVEFKAYFREKNKVNFQIHHERSTFEKENNHWKFVSGEIGE